MNENGVFTLRSIVGDGRAEVRPATRRIERGTVRDELSSSFSHRKYIPTHERTCLLWRSTVSSSPEALSAQGMMRGLYPSTAAVRFVAMRYVFRLAQCFL